MDPLQELVFSCSSVRYADSIIPAPTVQEVWALRGLKLGNSLRFPILKIYQRLKEISPG